MADSISSITSVQLRDSGSIGGQRFTIRRQLGAGSMGVVYEAHDRERDEIVALKTLLHAEASALYRFKREFRALADIHHRNLVALHELVVDDQTCFFTMECVEGVSFLEHLRPSAPALDSPTLAGPGTETLDVPTPTRTRAQVAEHRDADFITDDTLAFDPSLPGTSQLAASLSSATPLPSRSQASLAAEPDSTGVALVPSRSQAPLAAEPDGTGADHAPLARRRDLGPLDVPRLRAALAQLAEGVVALHRAGIVHRDLKPSNVLVANDGRVVILDFGLATELSRPDAPEGEDDGITGTAAYMAPEQVTHGRGVAASDWYAVGVMLYEALSGERPYTGPLLQVLLLSLIHI